MKARATTLRKDKSLLLSVAESIGSALGTIAAKAHVVEALARDPRTPSARPRASRLVGEASKHRRHTINSTLEAPTRSRLAKKTRRGSRKSASSRRGERAASTKSLHK